MLKKKLHVELPHRSTKATDMSTESAFVWNHSQSFGDTLNVMLPNCQRSAKTFSHLPGHELAEARRECEGGDQQGDQGGIHQAPDRKRRTVGSLMGVPATLFAHTWFLSGESGRAINSCLWSRGNRADSCEGSTQTSLDASHTVT